MADITNALYDALIASESAPITRVTDIDSNFPLTANSHIPVRVQITATGVETFLSYDELSITDQWNSILEIADGVDSLIDDIDAILQSTTALISGFTKPYTAENYRDVIEALKTLPDMLPAMGN